MKRKSICSWLEEKERKSQFHNKTMESFKQKMLNFDENNFMRDSFSAIFVYYILILCLFDKLCK